MSADMSAPAAYDASVEALDDASGAAGNDAYRVTIEHRDGTAEHYATARDDAYRLVLDELRNPTPGVCLVDIRPTSDQEESGQS